MDATGLAAWDKIPAANLQQEEARSHRALGLPAGLHFDEVLPEHSKTVLCAAVFAKGRITAF
jgi:hypothetical protein